MTGSRAASHYAADYLDGRTPARQPVAVRIMRTGLEIETPAGATIWWPFAEIRQTQGFYAGEQVRLERGGELPEILLVADTAFLAALRRVAPEATRRFHDPARRRLRARLTVLAAVAVLAVAVALYLWAIPALASVVAARVPVSWEEKLGAAVVDHVAPTAKRCIDPVRQAAIDGIVARLTAPLGSVPYRVRVTVVADPTFNALAAPGGYVIVFRGLLTRTETPEELAGVLAHELQHVLHRHATRALLQHASTGVLMAALVGDVSGLMAFGLESARLLGALRYSRLAEEEADREGIAMLQAARVDPDGMIAFFETLHRREADTSDVLRYLSSHPTTGDRIRTLRELTTRPAAPPLPLLPDQDWDDVKRICG